METTKQVSEEEKVASPPPGHTVNDPNVSAGGVVDLGTDKGRGVLGRGGVGAGKLALRYRAVPLVIGAVARLLPRQPAVLANPPGAGRGGGASSLEIAASSSEKSTVVRRIRCCCSNLWKRQQPGRRKKGRPSAPGAVSPDGRGGRRGPGWRSFSNRCSRA
ncbi:hypothetical protein BHE74_00058369 [Ensete ventricosum]|nr:hypothetical protein BHE74_00058369 [Ensete ventricosum]